MIQKRCTRGSCGVHPRNARSLDTRAASFLRGGREDHVFVLLHPNFPGMELERLSDFLVPVLDVS